MKNEDSTMASANEVENDVWGLDRKPQERRIEWCITRRGRTSSRGGCEATSLDVTRDRGFLEPGAHNLINWE